MMKSLLNKIMTPIKTGYKKIRKFWLHSIKEPIKKTKGYSIFRRFYNRHEQAFWGYMFISLWLIGYLVFTIVPVAQSFYYSLNDAQLKASTIELKYLGFQNYRQAFLIDTTFPTLIYSYIGEIIFNVPISIVFSLIIAMLLNQKIKGRGFWRVLFFLPVIISTGPLINELTSQGASTVPLLNSTGIQSFIMDNLPRFLYNPVLSLMNNIIMVLWFTGIPTLIFLAGLQKIDRSIYEAAAIDGASPWESFWKVTLPAVKQFIMVNVIYMFVTLSYYAGFTGNKIIGYIQDRAIFSTTSNFGYASSIAWIFFGVIVVLILIFLGLLNMKRD